MNNRFPEPIFTMREAKGADHYSIMMVNEALKSYQFKNDFPWLLVFTIKMKDVMGPFNVPTLDEANVLNEFEDSMTQMIKATVPVQWIGRITRNGHRYIYYYVESPKAVHTRIEEFVNSGEYTREFEHEMYEDVDWKTVAFFFNY